MYSFTSERKGPKMADDLLKRTTQEIQGRLKQLEPLVREHERLRRALSALTGGEETPKPTPKRRGSGRSQGQRAQRKQTKRAGRGERREQVLRVVGEEPGLTPSEAARRVGIQQSQLHSLVKRLEEEGAIERRDGALYPASTGAPNAPAAESSSPDPAP